MTSRALGERVVWHSKRRPISSTTLQVNFVVSPLDHKYIKACTCVSGQSTARNPPRTRKTTVSNCLPTTSLSKKWLGVAWSALASTQHLRRHRSRVPPRVIPLLLGAGGHPEDDPEPGVRTPLAARPAGPVPHRGRGARLQLSPVGRHYGCSSTRRPRMVLWCALLTTLWCAQVIDYVLGPFPWLLMTVGSAAALCHG